MKTFKQYLAEYTIDDGGLGFGVEDQPISYTPSSPSVFLGTQLGVSSKAIAGIDSENMPFINYRSSAMTPGSQQEDPRFVAGGGGFKIEKESKSYLLNLAKKYGILIPDQQQGGGQPQGQMGGPQMGGQQMGNMFGGPQMGGQQPSLGGEQQQQPAQDRLVKHLQANPMMSDLMSGELGQQFNKIFGEMQKWKTDAKDQKIIQKSQEPQNPYKIWNEKMKEEQQKKKQNLQYQANILRQRIFATNIYDRLYNMGLHDENNEHVKDYTDPYNHDQDLLQQQQQEYEQQQDQYYDQNQFNNDAQTGVDYGYGDGGGGGE
jgi:hypothetical protein